MRSKCAQRCFQHKIYIGRHAAVSITALASFASSWPLINDVHRRGAHSLPPFRERSLIRQSFVPGHRAMTTSNMGKDDSEWKYLFPFEDASHNAAKILVPEAIEENNGQSEDLFYVATFSDRLNSTVTAIRELEKSSVWVEVPISRSSLIEEMSGLGFQFHHAHGDKSVLNLWLKTSESLIPEFATHHIGVGALVINSREEVLCVRELRRNVMPWKIPGGLADLGEHIDEAAVREVLEETGIETTFRHVVCFRHTHGMANDRSDIYFVCRLDLIEGVDEDGNPLIAEPVPQENEIAATAWVPYSEFRDMVNGADGHPMINHVLNVSERGDTIDKNLVNSLTPGRKASPIYSAPSGDGKMETPNNR